MDTLEERLKRLGLSQYLEALVSEGFDTWETVLGVTESDLYVFSTSQKRPALTSM